jgi:hypothetical protein
VTQGDNAHLLQAKAEGIAEDTELGRAQVWLKEYKGEWRPLHLKPHRLGLQTHFSTLHFSTALLNFA